MNRVIFTFLFTLLSIAIFAQTNPKISIQGVLKDGNNIAVADGEYNLTFKLYTATGNQAEWTEVQNGISVTGGIYSAKLGAVTPIPTNIFDEALFLGVTVNGKELSPRVELTYAPYALSVETAQNVACSGKLGDIKYSILAPTDFQEVNGDCWVLMDGRGLAATNPLNANYGITTLPDGRGYFLRAHDDRATGRVDTERTASTAPGTVQSDDNKSHNHSLSSNGQAAESGGHSHGNNSSSGSLGLMTQNGSNTVGTDTDSSSGEANLRNGVRALTIYNDGAHTHNLSGRTDDAGGTESRPKNMNFYLYIRIN